MNRMIAIVLTLICLIVCGCPGLVLLGSVVSPSQDESTVQIFKETYFEILGKDAPTQDWNGSFLWAVKAILIVISLILFAFPVIIGLLAFSMAGKKVKKNAQPAAPSEKD